MTLTPALRKLVRTVHVICTVGWLGAAAGFLVLAVAGLTSRDAETVRAVYLAMPLIARFVILPFSLVPLLLTAPLRALGTLWGLFRHYWVIAELVINIVAVFLLLQHLQIINYLSTVAAAGTWSNADTRMQMQLVIMSSAALLVLLAATALAIFKPRGMTPYGRRKQQEERQLSRPYMQ